MTSTLPSAAIWVQALGIPIIAILISAVALRITWYQTNVAREKLRHDLYDRRFAIYSAYHRMLISLLESETIEENIRQATWLIPHAQFLLNKELCDYLIGIRNEAFKLRGEQTSLNQLGLSGEEYAIKLMNLNNAIFFLSQSYPGLAMRFEPFLKLDDFRNLTLRSTGANRSWRHSLRK